MRAIVVNEYGGPEVLRLQELAAPQPGPGEVLVRLHAASVNPVETYHRAGSQGYGPALPFIPGEEGAGIVAALGPGVSGLEEGQRVYICGPRSGSYAEYCLRPAERVVPVPEALSLKQAATLSVAYGTAYRALFQRGGAQPGETVLVHGASGGVGIATVQLARWRGLRVLATAGTDAGRALVSANGAEIVADHRDPAHFSAIRDAAGAAGLDVVIEMLANVNLESDLPLLAAGGRVMVVGSRGSVEITPRALMRAEADIRGVLLYGASEDDFADIHRGIAEAAGADAVQPVIQRSLDLAEAAEAHRAVIEDSSAGRIVLTMD